MIYWRFTLNALMSLDNLNVLNAGVESVSKAALTGLQSEHLHLFALTVL